MRVNADSRACFVHLGQRSDTTATGSSAAIRSWINRGRTEALNNNVRLITRCAYGFHSAKAALTLVMLTCRANHRDTTTRATPVIRLHRR